MHRLGQCRVRENGLHQFRFCCLEGTRHRISLDQLIQGYAVARTLEATEAELMQTIFPHPTLSEAMHESVLDAYGRAIHF